MDCDMNNFGYSQAKIAFGNCMLTFQKAEC